MKSTRFWPRAASFCAVDIWSYCARRLEAWVPLKLLCRLPSSLHVKGFRVLLSMK
jgi:hypothetical protein